MQGTKFLITITRREYEKEYLEFFKEKGVNTVLSMLANGTANQGMLEYLGLENHEKIVFNAIVRNERLDEIKKGLKTQMNISAVGNGIAIVLPVDSFGGKSSRDYFIGDKPLKNKGEQNMEQTNSVLIIAIVDKGYTDIAMDAAREVGASGGTVVKAKGTGSQFDKFFGVAISEEKEMVYVVSKREKRDEIMYAIMEKAGKDTDAHGIVFALPVENVVGINGFDE